MKRILLILLLISAITTIHAQPVGTIVAFAGERVPEGWLLCDGSILNAIDHGDHKYEPLYHTIGTVWGRGDGSANSFHLPDLRGIFLRGWEPAPNNDPDGAARTAQHPGGQSGNMVGSFQLDAFKNHNHNMHHWHGSGSGGWLELTTNSDTHFPVADDTREGGSETRPKNVYVKYIIKY